MAVDLDRLEALAQAASGGMFSDANEELLRALAPATILALVAVARAAKEYLDDNDSCWAADYEPNATELRAALAALETPHAR